MSVGYLLPLLLQTGSMHGRRLRLLHVQGLLRLLRLQRLWSLQRRQRLQRLLLGPKACDLSMEPLGLYVLKLSISK